MARLSHRRAAAGAALACGVLAGLAAGCSGHHPAERSAAGVAASVPDMNRLAGAAGCTVTGLRTVKDLRQGVCQTPSGHYTLVTFATDQGQNAWLDEAKKWGGAYLVGPRWVAVGTLANLAPLKSRLGGAIQPGDSHDHH
jgi:hypothetical protein